jgi:hypothetical protein
MGHGPYLRHGSGKDLVAGLAEIPDSLQASLIDSPASSLESELQARAHREQSLQRAAPRPELRLRAMSGSAAVPATSTACGKRRSNTARASASYRLPLLHEVGLTVRVAICRFALQSVSRDGEGRKTRTERRDELRTAFADWSPRRCDSDGLRHARQGGAKWSDSRR